MVRYVVKAIPLNCCNFIESIWLHTYTFSGRYQKKVIKNEITDPIKCTILSMPLKERRTKEGRRILWWNKRPGTKDHRCKHVWCEQNAHMQNWTCDHCVCCEREREPSAVHCSRMPCVFSENWKIYSLFNSPLRIVAACSFFAILYLSVVVECWANTIQPAWNRSEYQFWSHRISQMS